MTEQQPALAVGDFLVRSYGYDQTNIDFFKVVGLTPSGKSVRIQRWSKVIESGHGSPQEYVVPGDEPAETRVWNNDYSEQEVTTAPVMTKRINRYGGVTMDSYSYTPRWGGKAVYQTGIGWGH